MISLSDGWIDNKQFLVGWLDWYPLFVNGLRPVLLRSSNSWRQVNHSTMLVCYYRFILVFRGTFGIAKFSFFFTYVALGRLMFINTWFVLTFTGYWSLQGERKLTVLVGTAFFSMLHIFGIYWWYRNDDILYPLIMFSPKAIPQFWHAIFIILVNGIHWS